MIPRPILPPAPAMKMSGPLDTSFSLFIKAVSDDGDFKKSRRAMKYRRGTCKTFYRRLFNVWPARKLGSCVKVSPTPFSGHSRLLHRRLLMSLTL